jgi:hypothetical protein
MMIVLRRFTLIAIAIVLNACADIPVTTDYEPGWQPPEPAVYTWMAHKMNSSDPIADNDLVLARVHRSVDEQLSMKGFTLTDNEAKANMLLTYHIGAEEKLDINTFHSHYGYYPCWGCWGPGFDSDVWVTQYTQGRLIIDLIDAKTKQLVWRGVATRRVPNFDTPQQRDQYIRDTVAAIFKKFPPH